MNRSLILGGCGFIGRHLAKALLARGQAVTVVDVVPFPWRLPEGDPHYRTVDLSMASDREMDDLVADAEAVYHCAWSTIPQTANADPVGDLTANVGGTVSLLEALKRRGKGRVVFVSSGGTVYGRLASVPVPEDHPVAPITAYGASKVAAEIYLGFYRASFGIDTRVARLANPFGAGQNPQRLQGVATTVIYRALAGQPIEVWGDGEVVRDFVHISDAVEGLRLLDRAEITGTTLPVFNIASGSGASVNEVIRLVGARLGRPLQVERQPGRPFDVPISVLDITRARTGLGWQPLLDLQAGIDRTISDLLQRPGEAFSTLHAPSEVPPIAGT